MIRSASIPAQLALLFGLSLMATLGTGAVGFFATQKVTQNVAVAEHQHVPVAMDAAETAEILGRLELTALVYLNQNLRNASVETRIAQWTDALGQTGGDTLNAVLAPLEQALAAHTDAARYAIVMDGQTRTVSDLLDTVADEQAAYLTYIDKKARYGEKRGLINAPADTRFAKWTAGFEPPTPEFAKLVADVTTLEAEIVTKVADDFQAKGKVSELTATRLLGAPRIKLSRAMTLLQRAVAEQSLISQTAKAEALSNLQLTLQNVSDAARADHSMALKALSATVAQASHTGRTSVFGIILALALGALIAVAASLYAWRRIGAPMARLSNVIARLANQDYETDVPYRNRGDEIGTIAKSAETFRQAGLAQLEALQQAEEKRSNDQKQAVSALAKGLNRLASGDLACHVHQKLSVEYEPLRQDFNTAVAALSHTVSQISHSSGAMNVSVTELAKASDDLSQRTEQSAASLVQTSATLRQLSNLIEDASRGAVEANEISQTAKSNAEDSSGVLSETVEAMRDLEKSSGQIKKIVGMVDDIAFQTNLLALNAGVEAARAGNAGLGFSVVASEVRALAQRSSDAAQEISKLISTSGSQISKGVTLVDRVGDALASISQSVGDVSAHVSTIAASSRDQAVGINEISSAVAQLEQATQNNAAMFQQTTASTQSLAHEARALAAAADQFRLAETDGAATPSAPRSSAAAA